MQIAMYLLIGVIVVVTITTQDVAGLENAPTFEKFLLWNRDRIEIVDLVELSR